MAARDPTIPQLDFPQLVADLITTLRLTGQLGLLNMSDTVIPVISVGDVRPPTFSFTPVTFQSSQVFFGRRSDAVADFIIADTGPLPAGTYDIQCSMTMAGTIALSSAALSLQHRDAANTVTLAELLAISIEITTTQSNAFLPLTGYVIGLNERLRIKTPNILTTGICLGSIFAAIRPTP